MGNDCCCGSARIEIEVKSNLSTKSKDEFVSLFYLNKKKYGKNKLINKHFNQRTIVILTTN